MKRELIPAIAAGLMLCASASLGQTMGDRLDHALRQRTTADGGRSHLLSVLTEQSISVSFDETPAQHVFSSLGRSLGIPIVARYTDDHHFDGIDPETPITLEITLAPALTVLEAVLEQCADYEPTTWQLRRGYLEVGTKGRLSLPAAQELRVYTLRDLLHEPPTFDNAPALDVAAALNQGGGGGSGFGGAGGAGGGDLGGGSGGSPLFTGPLDPPPPADTEGIVAEIIEILQDTIEGDARHETWHVLGGDRASIRFFRGALLVRAPDYIHRQIGGYGHLRGERQAQE